MAYERNDRRYGSSDRGYGGADRSRGEQDYGREQYGQRDYGSYGGTGRRDYRGDRSNERQDYGRTPQGYDYQDRGFFDRAGDEVRSWFGDDDAERRRRADERYDQRYRDDYPSGDYASSSRSGASSYGSSDYGSSSRSYGGGDYGSNRSSGYGRGASDYGQSSNRNQGHDPSYSSWRDRQMAAFDQDYDEYRRENQTRFDSEFATWRQGRQGQRDFLTKVQEHQEVVGSDGQHVGTVDHVRGDRIQLTKNDQAAGGKHHTIPSSWITSVDEKVTLNKTADQAKQQWREDQRNEGGLFGRDDENNRSSSRSFSSSY